LAQGTTDANRKLYIKAVGGKGGIQEKTNVADAGGRYEFVVTFATPKMQINDRHLVADPADAASEPINLHQRSAMATFATKECFFSDTANVGMQADDSAENEFEAPDLVFISDAADAKTYYIYFKRLGMKNEDCTK